MPRINPKVQKALSAAGRVETARQGRDPQAEATLAAARLAAQRRALQEQLPEFIETAKLLGRLAAMPTTTIDQPRRQGHGRHASTVFEPILRGWSIAAWTVDSLPHAYTRTSTSSSGEWSPDTSSHFGSTPVLRSLLVGEGGTGLYLADTELRYRNPSRRKQDYQAVGLPAPASFELLENSPLRRIGHGNPLPVTTRTPIELLDGASAGQIEAALVGLVAVEHLRLPGSL